MSVEQRRQIVDVFKVIMMISLSISSFLLVQSYHEVRAEIRSLDDKLEKIESRTIRIEYELKLK